MISNVKQHPKFNFGQLNAYKLMFAMKFSMEKRIKKFWVAGFFLPAINATVFKCTSLSNSSFYPGKVTLYKHSFATSKMIRSNNM